MTYGVHVTLDQAGYKAVNISRFAMILVKVSALVSGLGCCLTSSVFFCREGLGQQLDYGPIGVASQTCCTCGWHTCRRHKVSLRMMSIYFDEQLLVIDKISRFLLGEVGQFIALIHCDAQNSLRIALSYQFLARTRRDLSLSCLMSAISILCSLVIASIQDNF